MATKTAEQRIEKAHLAIMKHPSFCAWSGLIFLGKWEVMDNAPAAAGVDTRGDVFYSRPFIDKIKYGGAVDSEVNFVVLHETGHKALMHLTRGMRMLEEDPQAFNAAADHVVNNMIREIDPEEKFAKHVRNPDGSLYSYLDLKYKGWSLKEVYDDIRKNGQGQQGQGGQGPKGFDQHIVIKVKGEGDQQGEGTGQNEGDKDGKGAHVVEITPEEMKALEKKIEDALRSGSYLAGKQGGNAKRLVGDLLDPKIDWKEQLAEFVTETMQAEDEATWRRPYRRFIGNDMYLPSYHQEAIGAIGCWIDVSGSVGHKEMMACITEVLNLCKSTNPSKLYLGYWDVGLTHVEEYTPDMYDQLPQLTKPKGGGGTDVRPVAEYANKIEDLMCNIILTDGYLFGGWGEWTAPTLWVMTTHVIAPIGKNLRIEI